MSIKSFKYWTNEDIIRTHKLSLEGMVANIAGCITLTFLSTEKQDRKLSAFKNYLSKMIGDCFRNNLAFRKLVSSFKSEEDKKKWEKEWTGLFWQSYNRQVENKKRYIPLRRASRRKTEYARYF